MSLHTVTWFDLNVGEKEAWNALVFRTYLALVSRNCRSFPHTTLEELAVLAQQPMPQAILHIQKLKLFLQIVKSEDESMIDAILAHGKLIGERFWLAELESAVEWFAQNRGEIDWPDFGIRDLRDPSAWKWAKNAHATIKKWVRQATKAHKIRIAVLTKLKHYNQGQQDILKEWGWTHNPPLHTEDTDAIAPFEECPDCGKQFKTKADVAVHQQRVHGKRIAVRRYVVDGCCRTCHRNFHSRARLIQHLHYGATTCWVKHMRKYIPMTQQEAAILDAKNSSDGLAHHQRGLSERQRGQTWRPCTDEEKKEVLQVKSDELEGEIREDEIKQWEKIGLL